MRKTKHGKIREFQSSNSRTYYPEIVALYFKLIEINLSNNFCLVYRFFYILIWEILTNNTNA